MAKIPTQKEEKQPTAKIPTHKYNKVSPIGKNQIDYKRSLESNTLTIVRGPAGTGKCIEGSTIIPTNDGLEHIENIFESDEDGYFDLVKNVYGRDGVEKTSKFYKESNAETIRVKTNQGFEICGTHEHPILTFDGVSYNFKALSDLKMNDVVCINRSENKFVVEDKKINYDVSLLSKSSKNINVPTTMTPQLASLLGYLTANGSKGENSIHMTTNSNVLGEDFTKQVNSIFNISCSHVSNDFKINSCNAIKVIEYICGRSFPTARFKTVPKHVLSSNKESMRMFLRSLFDCDGSLYNNVFEYSTASLQLGKEVQIMLLEFGIISRRKLTYNKKYDHTYTSIYITSHDLNLLFEKVLYDTLKYKFVKIENTNTNIDIIYNLNETLIRTYTDFKNNLKIKGNGRYKFENINKINTFNSDIFYEFKTKNVTYAGIDKIMNMYENSPREIQNELTDMYDNIKIIKDHNYFYDKISSIADDGIKTVYDFTVPKTHSFVSNGFISHNTFLPSVEAAELLRDGIIKNIVLVRPYVDLNNRGIGYLKGTEHEKLEPYVRPMLDAIKYVVGPLQLQKYLEEGAIEVKALASIRGMSYKETFLICDEMQGTVPNEIQALTTRIGKDSKMVIVGDTRQTDVRQGKENGLDYLIRIVNNYPIRDTGVIEMDINDIQRSGITKDFVLAYEKEGWQ